MRSRFLTRRALMAAALLATILSSAAAIYGFTGGGRGWSAEERATLRSLSLSSLGALPADPSTR
jgi:cytochrome c peroxidase